MVKCTLVPNLSSTNSECEKKILKDYVIDDIRLFVQCDSKLFHELLLDFSFFHPCFINFLASFAVITTLPFNSRGYSVEEENIHINLRPAY